MRTDLAYFTLDGVPFCECQQRAYSDRMRDAGNPPCCDTLDRQTRRFHRVVAVFPCRVALVHGACPMQGETE